MSQLLGHQLRGFPQDVIEGFLRDYWWGIGNAPYIAVVSLKNFRFSLIAECILTKVP